MYPIMFQLVITPRYKERPDREPVEEERPHIIGLSDAAAEFIVKARTDNRCFRRIIGPTSLGGLGETVVNGHWVPSLRFKPIGQQDENFLKSMENMVEKLSYRFYKYPRSRVVLVEVETDLDPDSLTDRINSYSETTVQTVDGRVLGDAIRVHSDPADKASSGV